MQLPKIANNISLVDLIVYVCLIETNLEDIKFFILHSFPCFFICNNSTVTIIQEGILDYSHIKKQLQQ